jgi:hypothetical protein
MLLCVLSLTISSYILYLFLIYRAKQSFLEDVSVLYIFLMLSPLCCHQRSRYAGELLRAKWQSPLQ